MSVGMMARVWALDDERVRLGTRLVLLALADHADERGACWPSVERLASHAGLTTRQVRRAVGALIEWGYVRAERQGGRGKASVYVLALPIKKGDISDTSPQKEDICDSDGAQKEDICDTLPTGKADISDTSPRKADIFDRYGARKGDIYDTSARKKADICDGNPDICDRKEDISAQKADIGPHTREEPPIEPSEIHQEPSDVFVGVPPTHTDRAPTGKDAGEFGAEWTRWLKALAWVCYGHQDLDALTADQLGALTGEGKRMFAGGYRRDDLQRWLDEEWRRKWAGHFAKHGSYPRPRPDEVRAGIPAVRAGYAESPVEESVAPRRAKAGDGHGGEWGQILREVLMTMPSESPAREWLTGSSLVAAGEVDGVPLYRVILRDASGVGWVRDRLGPRLRRDVSALVGEKVLVEVAA